MKVRLTVADHEKNGFVHLAEWPRIDPDLARCIVRSVDDEITNDMEPDKETAPFTFILDLINERDDGGDEAVDGDLIDTGDRMLPLQIANRMAPEEVNMWLVERPEPDEVMHRPTPIGDISKLSPWITTEGAS